MTEDQRKSIFRRQVNEVGWPDMGKALCAFILYKNYDTITNHWDALFVLLLFLIAPRMIEKFLNVRWGNGGQMTTTVDTHEKTTKEVVNKPAEPKQGGFT